MAPRTARLTRGGDPVNDAAHPFQIACTTNVVGPVGALIGWAENPKHPAATFRHSYGILPHQIIEAAPGGVRYNHLDAWTGAGITVYSDFKLTTDEQDQFTYSARKRIGMPYDYLGDLIVGLDGLWLDAVKNGRDPFRIAERLEDRAHHRVFCSSLADELMTESGHQVFTDGRPFHAVNPNELALRLITLFPKVNAEAAQAFGLAA